MLQTWGGGGTPLVSFNRSVSGSRKGTATQSIKAGYQRDTSLSSSRKQRDAVRATVPMCQYYRSCAHKACFHLPL